MLHIERDCDSTPHESLNLEGTPLVGIQSPHCSRKAVYRCTHARLLWEKPPGVSVMVGEGENKSPSPRPFTSTRAA